MIYIATPSHSGAYCAGYVKGLVSMSGAGIPWGFVDTLHESSVARARNKICAAFLQTGAPWLLFIDDDMTWNAADVGALLHAAAGQHEHPVNGKTIRSKRAVVGGAYVKKTSALTPTWDALPDAEETAEDVIEVARAGTGFLLIARDVLASMAPSLKTNSVGPIWFDHEPSADGSYRSEDQVFCDRYRAMGGKVWLHRRVSLGHVGQTEYRIPLAEAV